MKAEKHETAKTKGLRLINNVILTAVHAYACERGEMEKAKAIR